LNDPTKYSTLRSALAVPMEGASGVAAVLALYRARQDAFTSDDLRAVETIVSGLGTAIESVNQAKVSAVSAGSK
jgi:GAF domain-containing protein